MPDPVNTDRMMASLRQIIRAEFPQLTFLGAWSYAVQTVHGSAPNWTVDIQQTDTANAPLPTINGCPVTPAVGWTVKPSVGSNCVVMFVNGDQSRPLVVSMDPAASEVEVGAGGQVPTEHVATMESVVTFVYNTFASLALITPALWTGTALQITFAAAINAALAALKIPAPPGLPAQIAAANAQLGQAVAGTVVNTSLPFPLTGIELKTPNVSGLFPSLGCPAVKGG